MNNDTRFHKKTVQSSRYNKAPTRIEALLFKYGTGKQLDWACIQADTLYCKFTNA